MACLRFVVLFSVICSCLTLGLADIEKPKTEVIDVLPPVPRTVTIDTNDKKEPSQPTEPTPPIEPSTHPEPDTTPSSDNTTTTTTTTTTTPKPSPSPSPKPTPPPKPTPLPQPEQGTWSYTDSNNITCVIVQFAARLDISYLKSVNNGTVLSSVVLNVPANATVPLGSCNATKQWLDMSWPSDVVNSTVNNTIRIIFLKNDTTKSYALSSLDLNLDAMILVNFSSSSDVVQLKGGEEWQTPLATSYRCNTPTQVRLSDDKGSVVANLTLSNLQEEAFRSSGGKGFSAARECGSGDVPDAVPIAVGCALGGLVLIVLVAYLVARRRSAARGYLSM